MFDSRQIKKCISEKKNTVPHSLRGEKSQEKHIFHNFHNFIFYAIKRKF